MPEGDILRRTARTLDRALTGNALVRAELRWPDAAGVDLVGRTVLGTSAYGKHLFTRFDDGRSLHTHLRMEGSWRLERTGGGRDRAAGAFVRAVLATATWTAIGHRLGMLDVVPTAQEQGLIGHLGPDALADDFPTAGLPESLRRAAERGATPIAEVLLDQTVVAGFGTVYMAEALYVRRIWPWTPTDEVADLASLMMTGRVLMQRGVESDLPVPNGERAGGRDNYIHNRGGRPCRRCGAPIARGLARKPPQERPVYYCPVCQADRRAPTP